MKISNTDFSIKQRRKKTRKRLLLGGLTVIISLGLTACGGGGGGTPPVITLLGNNPTVIFQDANADYNDAGATAKDDVDGEVNVETSGSVDTATEGEYIITYTATDSFGNTATATRTVHVNNVAASISVDKISIAAHEEDPGVVPTALKAGNVYNFVVDFTSTRELTEGVTFTLVLIPDVSGAVTEANSASFALGSDTIYLDSETSDEDIPAGKSGLYIKDIMIPSSIDTEKDYILMAYLHEGGLLDHGVKVNLDSTAEKTEGAADHSTLIEHLSVNLLAKTENDIDLDAIHLLDELTFVENDRAIAITNGYMELPFVDSEVEFFSNNENPVETTLRAVWVTPVGEEVPLYFYDESSAEKMVDHETITIPSSKRATGDMTSRIAPYLYPAELHLNEAGWEKLIQYAGDPTQGEAAYQAKIKYYIESSDVNANNKNDTLVVTHFTLEIDSVDITHNKDAAARTASYQQKESVLFADDDEIERDIFDYKKEWEKSWGNESKVALQLAAGINAGVDLVPVPTIDAVGAASIRLHLFNSTNKMLEYRLQFAEGLNVVVDGNGNRTHKFKKGLEQKFILFNAVISQQGSIEEEEANKNAKDSQTMEDAKKEVNNGSRLSRLIYEREWKEEKELFSKSFTVGPVPVTIQVGVEYKLPLKLGLQPNGFGVELFTEVSPKVNVLAQGGVGFSFASVGILVDFLIVENKTKATAGLKIVYKDEQFTAQLYSNGTLEIEAIKGTLSLYAEAELSYPCGYHWVFSIEFCKLTAARYTLPLYETPAVIKRKGDDAISLWQYENSFIHFDIPTDGTLPPGTLPSGSYQQSCGSCSVSGSTLSCNCRSVYGYYYATSINYGSCYNGIDNINGTLECR